MEKWGSLSIISQSTTNGHQIKILSYLHLLYDHTTDLARFFVDIEITIPRSHIGIYGVIYVKSMNGKNLAYEAQRKETTHARGTIVRAILFYFKLHEKPSMQMQCKIGT
jgi:ABC-type iron transport system FetAB permease component